MAGQVFIGISGWRYHGWKGKFYPPGLPPDDELKFAARHTRSLEINGSFYSLQTPSRYRQWYREVPPGFLFAVKGPRFITHLKQLHDVTIPLANFFASGVLQLGEKLGPILWQFPQRMIFRPERFAPFFDLLPRTFADADRLARRHDHHVPRARYTPTGMSARNLRYAIEVRHESFRSLEFRRLLQQHRIALVVSDAGARWPRFDDLTTDFAYVRLHGGQHLYAGGYGPKARQRWAKQIAAWRRERDVFVYFDNDAEVRAPADALALQKLIDESFSYPTLARMG